MQSLKQIVQIDQAIDDLKGVFPGPTHGQYLFIVNPMFGYAPSTWSQVPGLTRICTRAEFEARKAERQGKPSWDEHDYKFIHQGKNGHWYGSLKDNPASLPDIITDECWYYIEAASARRGEVFGDYRNTLEQRPSQIHPTGDLGRISGSAGAAEPAGRIGCGSGLVGVNPNYSVESDEKGALNLDLEMGIAKSYPALALHLAKEKLEAYQDSRAKPGNSADWYDYENQAAIKLPPVGELVEAAIPHTNGRDEKSVIWIEGRVIAYHEINGKQYAWFAEDGDNGFYTPNVLQFRPLDWNRKQEVPSPSPELSFHLSNAFNELQASARLLPEDDPRRAQIVALAGGVSAVKEVV